MENKRRFFRVETGISGVTFIKGQRPINITNISLSGLMVEFPKGIPVFLRKNDEIRVEYKLDKAPYKEYSEDYQVMWIKGNSAGLKLIGRPVYQKEKGFYIKA